MLAGRQILLIIGGDIAACRTLELIRLLRAAGAGVVPVMTQASAQFVTPLSVATLAGHRVYRGLADLKEVMTTGQVQRSLPADLIVVAPATAVFLAKMADGQADDLASTLVLTTDRPVLVAPAMNLRVWDHVATRRTMVRVLARGVTCIGPDSDGPDSGGMDRDGPDSDGPDSDGMDSGGMGSGDLAPGRMAAPEVIMQAIRGMLAAGSVQGSAAGRGAAADPTGAQPQGYGVADVGRSREEGARGCATPSAAITSAASQTPRATATDAARAAAVIANGPAVACRAATDPAVTDSAATVPPGPLSGRHVLITSGPTHEPIDPVRYIANRSSGAQGAALAVACRDLGARVTFVTGPASVPPPPGVHVVRVETALEMLAGVQAALPADVAIFAAAVADWRVANAGAQKLKKTEGGLPVLEFAENPDILATIAAHAQRPGLVVGFAAETHDVVAYAHAKRLRKGCDWIVANDVSPATGIMGGSDNAVHLITAQGAEVWPMLPKSEVARRLAARIAAALPRDAGGSGGGRDRAALADDPAPPDPAQHDPAQHDPAQHDPDVS